MESLASLSWSCNADLSWSQVQLEQIWALPSGASGGGCYGGQEEGSELEMEGIWQLQAASNRSLARQAVCNLRHASVPFKHLQVTALERWRAQSGRAWNSLVRVSNPFPRRHPTVRRGTCLGTAWQRESGPEHIRVQSNPHFSETSNEVYLGSSHLNSQSDLEILESRSAEFTVAWYAFKYNIDFTASVRPQERLHCTCTSSRCSHLTRAP